MDWNGQKVVVTGGAGFIGSHLVELLVERGADVMVIDNLSRGNLDNLRAVARDITLAKIDLENRVPTFDRDAVVFHLAAKVAGIQYNRTHQLDMLNSNMRINNHVLRAAEAFPPKLLVVASTACVYGHDAPVPTPESAANGDIEPTNYGYGLAKWVMEKQATFLHQEQGIPVAIPRFFNAIGTRDYYDETAHVVPALIKRAVDGENPFVVWGTGKQTRTFVDAADIAKALVLLAECEAAHDAQPVNISSSVESSGAISTISIDELAGKILWLCGYGYTEIEHDLTKPDGHSERRADVTRLRELVGWIPDTPLIETLDDMIKDYRGCHAQTC
jgi:nucleoside-diphosphate-sugar epimerase